MQLPSAFSLSMRFVALSAMLSELVPKFLDMVCTEKDRSFSMTALHCLQEMLEKIGEPVLRVSDDTFTTIISTIKDVLRGRVRGLLIRVFGDEVWWGLVNIIQIYHIDHLAIPLSLYLSIPLPLALHVPLSPSASLLLCPFVSLSLCLSVLLPL